jgi:hypothetical protein
MKKQRVVIVFILGLLLFIMLLGSYSCSYFIYPKPQVDVYSPAYKDPIMTEFEAERKAYLDHATAEYNRQKAYSKTPAGIKADSVYQANRFKQLGRKSTDVAPTTVPTTTIDVNVRIK